MIENCFHFLILYNTMCSIFDNKAKKTLLGTIRNHWPHGVYNYRDISAEDPKWLENVCTEFNVIFSILYTHTQGLLLTQDFNFTEILYAQKRPESF